MRFLHTSDWHVGKTLRGRSRTSEHRAVLADIVRIASENAVDAVLVAGDLFDSAAPPPEAEEIVYRALVDLAETGARVHVIAGNHDNPRRLAAVAPLLARIGVEVVTDPRRPEEGGLATFTASDGTQVALARLPFVSQRAIVRSDELMGADPDEHALTYADRLAHMTRVLVEAMPAECVRILATHSFVEGGSLGGGERSAHTIFDYAMKGTAFPGSLHYVALGHLHRTQRIAAPCPVWYCGSPLQLDFGETEAQRSVLVVEADPSAPAIPEVVPIEGGRTLVTLRGTLDEIEAEAGTDGVGDAWVRCIVKEKPRIGLADDVRRVLPDCVDVIVERVDAGMGSERQERQRVGRTPRELFAEFLHEKGDVDERLLSLFDELLDEVTSAT